jgi:DNA-binding transcriptional MerR regulator
MARDAGLTVRTLRHYDQIGLLTARQRTGSGHRRYSENDLYRLLRIRALRRLGLSLEDVRRVLEAPADDPEALQGVLRAELQRLEARAGELASTIAQVRNLLDRMDGRTAGPDLLMKTMEVHTMLEGYFTDDQRQRIVERRDRMGTEQDAGLRSEWVALFKDLNGRLLAGTPAGDPEVQAMSARWDEIGTSFTGADPDILASADRLWQENKAAVSDHVGHAIGFDPKRLPAVVEYVQEARAARSGQSG